MRKYFHDNNELISEMKSRFASKFADFYEAGILKVNSIDESKKSKCREERVSGLNYISLSHMDHSEMCIFCRMKIL